MITHFMDLDEIRCYLSDLKDIGERLEQYLFEQHSIWQEIEERMPPFVKDKYSCTCIRELINEIIALQEKATICREHINCKCEKLESDISKWI